MKLEELKTGSTIVVEPSGQRLTLVSIDFAGADAVRVVCRSDDNSLDERVFYRSDEAKLTLPEREVTWTFDAGGELFRMAAEARRIQLAHHFDPLLAVNTSVIDPLPHQITAVYQEMLPRQPLRFLLADDPGAGKTIMAGLLIKELIVRGDLGKCMVVCPGSLVEQWQDELWSKFQLPFEIMTNDKLESSRTGNWFQENPLAICRLDKLSRDEKLHLLMREMDWDLVIVDEAHKMSASAYGREVNRTKRYSLGEMLSTRARHFLLMTATPHNGKDESFQLFLKLIDQDRFEGSWRRRAKTPDVSDMMRRMVKEELLKFDGTKLFPERIAYTANYVLSDLEEELYEQVSDYVRIEFNRAERLSKQGMGTVGFALTVLQRRLASSPAAIHASLKRRAERLEARLDELRAEGPAAWVQRQMGSMSSIGWDDDDDLPREEFEEEVQKLLDESTASTTEAELEAEIKSLRALERMAARVKSSGQDRKWDELSALLDHPEMVGEDGVRRKLVIFTEHLDTLKYLFHQISSRIGHQDSIVTITGGMGRNARKASQEAFRNDPEVHFLLATDAAGEGINLQRAHLMVNYDLPWNPNRIEQRFGRIHRIGQQEVCHLWNLVAENTREGQVFTRLFEKLATMRASLGGSVYDVLGQVFREERLEDLLKEAIRYSNLPEVKAQLFERVDNLLEQKRVQDLIEQQALVKDVMDFSQVEKIRDEMDRAAASRLQPHHISPFFRQAFEKLGGQIRPRESGRFEIVNVPDPMMRWSRAKRPRSPITKRYRRVTFSKDLISIQGKPDAEFLSPGHPLLDTVVDMVLERWRPLLKQGATLVDPLDQGDKSRLLVMLEHAITDGRRGESSARMTASRRFQFVEIDEEGKVVDAGPAPFLEYAPLQDDEFARIEGLVRSEWLAESLEETAVSHAIERIVPRHLEEITASRTVIVQKTIAAVQERLSHEIQYQNKRYVELKAQQDVGKQPKMNPQAALRAIDELEARRDRRLEELNRELDLTPQPPVVVGAALIIPAGLIGRQEQDEGLRNDPETERIAMESVMAYERSLGNVPTDVSDQKVGYDVESKPKEGRVRFVEVKGRKVGSRDVAITRNEILTALNSPDQYHLALVWVENDGMARQPIYMQHVFNHEPEMYETYKALNISQTIKALGIDE